ncbi:phage tail protein [Cytobacillus spongiae]|uniref:phage tail protein n=1 Tax=Cytobacillus spongiae TaxID=2901381 RepID=UPI001F3AFFF6|nr:phage tail protein [Cytobacillus spongiae]UII56713.1 phage tail protein [Cytobacillus spongiae]
MTITITEFDSVAIKNASVQFFDGATKNTGTKFGCVGDIEGETEAIEIVKKCAGVEVKKITKPTKMNMKVNAHIPVQVARDYFGLSNDKLKPGIWAYGSMSKGKSFVFTADVIDEFEDVVKLIAFSNCSNSTGFKIAIENGSDEVAMLEIEFTGLADSLGNFYYETLVDELDDPTVAEQWHTEFTPSLIQVPTV